MRDAILIPSSTHTLYKKCALKNAALILLPSSFRLEGIRITLDIKMRGIPMQIILREFVGIAVFGRCASARSYGQVIHIPASIFQLNIKFDILPYR